MLWKQLKIMLQKLVFTFDMFKAPACLRAKGEPDVSRLCPGIVSLLLAIFFIYMVVSKFMDLIDYRMIGFSRIYEVTL